MRSIAPSAPPETCLHPYRNRGLGQMNRFFVFLLFCLFLAQILLSKRPSEIDFSVLFHIGTLGIFLFFGLCTILIKSDHFPMDPLTLVALLFTVYFYTAGVIVSAMNGVGLLGTIEFPHRISNLFMVLVLPWFVRREKELSQVFTIIIVMMGLQIVRDLAMGSVGGNEALLVERLWSPEFSSVMFLATLPFAFGGLIAYWNTPSRRALKRSLILVLWALLFLKLFLTYSRAVWLIVFPLNMVGVIYLLYRKSRSSRNFRRWGIRATRLIIFLALAGVTVFSLITVFSPKITEFIMIRKQYTGRETEARLAEYQNAIEEWLTSPLLGKGFGYETRFYKSGRTREQEYVHNFILQFLMSSGVTGLVLILALLGATFSQLLRLFKRSRSLLQTAILIASLLTLFNIVLLSSVQTVILKQEVYFLLAVVISFAIIIDRLQRQELLRTARITRINEAHPRGWEGGRLPGWAGPWGQSRPDYRPSDCGGS